MISNGILHGWSLEMLRAAEAQVKNSETFCRNAWRFLSPNLIVSPRGERSSASTHKQRGQRIAHIDVPWYIGTTMKTARYKRQFVVERVQTGVRIEKRLLKVLKALAAYHDLTLGDLLEGIVLHAFDGKTAFQKPSRRRIKELKKFYGLDLDFRASHRLIEARPARPKVQTKPTHRALRVKRALRAKKSRGAK